MAHGCIRLSSISYYGERINSLGWAAKYGQSPLLSGGWSEAPLTTPDCWGCIQESKAQLFISVRQSREIHSSAFNHKITEQLSLEKLFKIIELNQHHHHVPHFEKTLSIPPETATPVGSPTQPRCSMLTLLFLHLFVSRSRTESISLFSTQKMSMDSRI